MMTRKDNMMAIYNHQSHDHIGCLLDMGGVGGDDEEFENGPLGGGGADGFGVIWAKGEPAAGGGGTPAPGHIVLPDITEWRDYVHFPDVSKYDWQSQADRQLARVDRKTQVIDYRCYNGPFLRLVDLMGMVEGLVSFSEEPEACEELLTAITDYRISTLEYIKKYFDPDIVTIFDDFAHERGLFISPDTYAELISPQHKRWADAVRSYGMIPDMHVCGKAESVVPSFIDEGFEAWQIVQQENDIVRLQEEVGDRLAFYGCWDLQAKWIKPGTRPTDDELRAKVREAIDLYGPGGNLALMCVINNPAVDTIPAIMTMNQEVIQYSAGYYCR
ncbi:MAG: hypothetical protein J5827_05175 [Oscillospiraceae bacterium]|nr:hypothetical protein [Oscillospiraceae bacterium]